MSCPKCGSNNIWDDMAWWGCNDCNFASNTISNKNPERKQSPHEHYMENIRIREEMERRDREGYIGDGWDDCY